MNYIYNFFNHLPINLTVIFLGAILSFILKDVAPITISSILVWVLVKEGSTYNE